MKNLLFKIFLLLFFCTSVITKLTTTDVHAMPYLEAQGVVLMDGITGKVLYSKNADTQFEPASTTKIMTAIVVLENCELNEPVTVGVNPPMVDGSAIGIREGEVYTVEELLLALLLESANDCAEALAEHVAGSNAEFGKLMTEKAKDLGAVNTVFKNPSGLSEEGHVTTAYDLSLMMRYALAKEDLISISRTISHKYENHPYSDGTEKWATNRNNCYVDWSPYYYENLYAGKTGYTPEANHTYTAAAVKDDQVLVASFLNAYNKADHYSNVGPLFNWGFENFKTVKIVEKGEELAQYQLSSDISMPLLASDNIYYVFDTNEDTTVEKSVTYEDKDLSKSSILKGDSIFTATLNVNGESYTTLNLLSGIDREYTVQVKLDQTVEIITSNKLLLFGIAIGILIVIYIIYYFYDNYKKRNKFRKKYNL